MRTYNEHTFFLNMIAIKSIRRKCLMALATLLVSSCGLMELEEEQYSVVNMYFDNDTIYTMVGERFTVTPRFIPDSVIIDDIFWKSSVDSIVYLEGNDFVAMNEGWSTLTAVSVQNQIEDSCHVCVLPRWDMVVPTAPYETIFYADVTAHGKPFDPATMLLGAFVGKELRGVGVMREQYGIKYMEIRVGSEIFNEVDPFEEIIEFRIFDKTTMRSEKSRTFVIFDGASHGSLSNLFKIDVK